MAEENPVVTSVRQRFPDAVLGADEFRGQTTILLRKEDLIQVCQFLRDDPDLKFDTLLDVTVVDWLPEEPRFEVVYHLRSLPRQGFLRLKVLADGNDPRVPTVSPVWPTANWHERETFDMFGIIFEGHPNLARILMPDDWQGHPLRKDHPLGYEEVAFTHNAEEIFSRKPRPRE